MQDGLGSCAQLGMLQSGHVVTTLACRSVVACHQFCHIPATHPTLVFLTLHLCGLQFIASSPSLFPEGGWQHLLKRNSSSSIAAAAYQQQQQQRWEVERVQCHCNITAAHGATAPEQCIASMSVLRRTPAFIKSTPVSSRSSCARAHAIH